MKVQKLLLTGCLMAVSSRSLISLDENNRLHSLKEESDVILGDQDEIGKLVKKA
jgi:hypothetical protein